MVSLVSLGTVGAFLPFSFGGEERRKDLSLLAMSFGGLLKAGDNEGLRAWRRKRYFLSDWQPFYC